MRTFAIWLLLCSQTLSLANASSIEPKDRARSTIFPIDIPSRQQNSEIEKAVSGRGTRLDDIARRIQDSKSDATALVTEAARLCGFSIWKENREVVSQPIGESRIGLALTDVELRTYSKMFRNGVGVRLSSLIACFDYIFKTIGADYTCGPKLREWITTGSLKNKPSHELVGSFIQSLANNSDDPEHSLFLNEDPKLDAIQMLLIIRMFTEEIRFCVGRDLKSSSDPFLLASLTPEPQQGLLPGWSEDLIVNAELFGMGEALRRAIEAGSGLAERIDRILKGTNIGLLAIKVFGIYSSLAGDVWCVDPPGQPLVRFKVNTGRGEMRQLRARFKIDANALSNYLKENRFAFTMLGIDVDAPRSEALKDVETEWKWGGCDFDGEDILETSDRLDRVMTDSSGNANIQVYGKRRHRDLSREPELIPISKKVKIRVTPQVKASNMLQDLVDAGSTAAAGPLGIFTLISEMLFRAKIFGTETLDLIVKDWLIVRTSANVSIRVQGNYSVTTTTGSASYGLDRGLVFTDISMQDQTFPAPPPVDWSQIPDSPSKKRAKQGYEAQVEASKRSLFLAEKNGSVSSHVNDYMRSSGTGGDCGGSYRLSGSSSTVGVNNDPFVSILSDPSKSTGMLMIAIREDQKKIWITAETKIKGRTLFRSSQGTQSRDFEGNVFDNVELDPTISEGKTLVLPLQVGLKTKNYSQWGGTFPFAFKWNERSFHGTAGYVVIRKLLNTK